MNEKTKKYFLSLAVRTAVSLGMFAVVFAVCKIFPQVLTAISPVWTKSMDIQKIGAFLFKIGKEMLP